MPAASPRCPCPAASSPAPSAPGRAARHVPLYNRPMARQMLKSPVPGERFGRLTVLTEAPTRANGVRYVQVRCNCGVVKETSWANVFHGVVVSCGCAKRRHNMTGHPAYETWRSMRARCGRERRRFPLLRRTAEASVYASGGRSALKHSGPISGGRGVPACRSNASTTTATTSRATAAGPRGRSRLVTPVGQFWWIPRRDGFR